MNDFARTQHVNSYMKNGVFCACLWDPELPYRRPGRSLTARVLQAMKAWQLPPLRLLAQRQTLA